MTRDVAIVGAGIAGIGMGIRLARAGRDDFVLLERAGDVGGTWRDNVYPGVACDIPSHLYEYSFRPKDDWSHRFATGSELHGYLRDAADAEGLGPHLRLETPLDSAEWDGDAWTLHTPSGAVRSRVLVMAAGRLSEPRTPSVPGLGSFPGNVFHSARWAAGPLEGLRVGIVGTGASAVQIVPEVARDAASVVVFQRTPAWVLPRGDRAYAPDETRPTRSELAAEAEGLFAARLAGSDAARALEDVARGHLQRQVADPVLRAALTPDYDIGCKRAVFSDDYYSTLARPHVALEPSALAAVDGSAAVAASGARYELDVLVLATGFETTRPPFADLVSARGVTLAEHWADGMTSHASTVVSGFPNLFVLDGPNSALGHHSAFEVIEAQLDYVLGALEHLDAAGGVLEVTAEAEARYTELVDGLAARTVWTQGGCASWYLDDSSGRLTLVWPERAELFRRLNGTFDPEPFAARESQPA
ncbi:NAD(P)/FAD-dependent oxidoreductase [Tsukamurella sp. 8F]|uniref:flavin-containing monooxygenase n=1 Tax=unclassified Tsukamurella TaxID=2633480 RepID=UPI0023B8C91A|nr:MULTISPECIES: NAD(P)/FAD-dependent oxidoreductase [unclassified Tsukamurella]MDF0531539.1 NAD(P)/FAD-dependent oxidoreductase [Tsukamurella sp. 8J]MDF0588849.1 NAD(P)/FAD-dependent oxidoreductase [Tsukamurella sp. 8F]